MAKRKKGKNKPAPKKPKFEVEYNDNEVPNNAIESSDYLDLATLPKLLPLEMLEHQIQLLAKEITNLEVELGLPPREIEVSEEEEQFEEAFEIPVHSVPIRSDVRSLNWKELSEWCQFDVIVMDPPWQLASKAPTRGVALGYSQLPNKDIIDMQIPLLQKNGFIFIWVINSRYAFALEMMKAWGYTMVDDITWVKSTVNRRLAKGHGFYLQHAKETCLVGKKGKDPPNLRGNIASDVIFSQRRGQSQKPTELYEIIEEMIPFGNYLEIFARRNNLRDHWVSIGLEL